MDTLMAVVMGIRMATQVEVVMVVETVVMEAELLTVEATVVVPEVTRCPISALA